MNIFIKKVFFFPFLLFSALLPILFLSGCLFGGVKGDSVSLTYTIGGKKNVNYETNSGKKHKKFERWIGSSKSYKKTVFGAEVVKFLLGTKNSSDDFKKKIQIFADDEFGTSSNFWNDYINSKGRFTQIENQFEALNQKITIGKNDIWIPSKWEYIEKTKKIKTSNIKISEHKIKMIYGAPTKQGSFKAKKWEIIVKLKTLSFTVPIAADRLKIDEYEIEEIKEIEK